MEKAKQKVDEISKELLNLRIKDLLNQEFLESLSNLKAIICDIFSIIKIKKIPMVLNDGNEKNNNY